MQSNCELSEVWIWSYLSSYYYGLHVLCKYLMGSSSRGGLTNKWHVIGVVKYQEVQSMLQVTTFEDPRIS